MMESFGETVGSTTVSLGFPQGIRLQGHSSNDPIQSSPSPIRLQTPLAPFLLYKPNTHLQIPSDVAPGKTWLTVKIMEIL